MTPDEMTAFFARRRQAREAGDIPAMVADYAEDCVLETQGFGTLVGRAAVEQYLRRRADIMPDLQGHEEDLIVMGERAVMLGTVSSQQPRGGLRSLLGGKPFTRQVIAVYEIRNHQILRERVVYDLSGIFLEHLRKDLKTAAQIQRALLPVGQVSGAGYEAFAESMPCRQIGGDFVDFFELPHGALGLLLGDVAGKGPPAALLAAMLQGSFASHIAHGGTPAEIVGAVNRVFLRRGIESRFATVFYAVLSEDGRLTSCNAGHNPPIVVGRHGTLRLQKGGCVLGMFEDAPFEEETVQLEPEDVLLTFSDGVTEAVNRDEEEFSDDRLVSWAMAHRDQTPSTFVASLLEELRSFCGDTVQADDLTCLVLRYSGAR
jgi:hypothetical protein